ncbi:MAG: acyl-CoA dehydratase activase-related protein [Bifidobacteriaceae bacterium]|nr:acyl-CoA dehydratase activase-related protein [Bifidobacteriaceae bacterium]
MADSRLQTLAAKSSADSQRPLRVGLDVGSTTVKAVVLKDVEGSDKPETIFSDYRRHHANVRATAADLIEDIHKLLIAQGNADAPVHLAITGSGGLGLADSLHVQFIQEVIAETEAIQTDYPQADVIIELGGEDAKITYLKPTPEQRMNGSCAGGTGAFIDQMATLLNTDAAGLNDYAKNATTLYPIASRCGVFAKSDLQPLINDGAAKEDLAASIFNAVSTQTIAGLACGRPVKGTVVFLGGPLFFMSELREAFRHTLEGVTDTFITPKDAHLAVAYGAALLAGSQEGENTDGLEAVTCAEILTELQVLSTVKANIASMRPLFKTPKEREDFDRRHGREQVTVGTLEGAKGPHFLGIDAGSTTIKAALVNDDQEIVWSSYATNQGSPLTGAAEIIKKITAELPSEAYIARSCATGYGEGLITAGLHLDEGEVETMAHYRGAEVVSPGVTSVIDIGGQDMKYLAVTDGVIDSIAVNEACSSGCGSFLQTFAQSMGLSIEEFTQAALRSTNPVDLGSRCTVFMNSSVKQAQKEGATIEDIAAGLCYSVVRNALYKVIKLRDSGDLGSTVVVQGGTFLNDAVLRAFELLTNLEVTRPNIAGLMGAYGAALTARMHYGNLEEDEAGESSAHAPRVSNVLTGEALEHLSMTTSRDVCKLCQNHCKLTITTFEDSTRYVTGNRCERGGDRNKKKSTLPNLYDYKYKRAFGFRRLTEKKATRGDIGIPRVLNMYENYPFWFTLLTKLGFRVMISKRSSHEVFEKGIDTIASENICYPAKMVHGHIRTLLEKGVKTIFYPCVSYEENFVDEADNNYNCPIVANYPMVIGANMPDLREPGIRYMHPYFNLANREIMADRIVEEFAWANVSHEEAEAAVQAAYAEAKLFRKDVQNEGLRALAYMREHNVRGIVLAGRPYHIDPEINHGIPETINTLGMAVLSEDSISELAPKEIPNLSGFTPDGELPSREKDADGFRKTAGTTKDGKKRIPLRVMNQWAYHSRLYAAARFVAEYPGLELVQLNSFGCGLDAITTDQVQEILADKQDVYTTLKIDEVTNLGAAKIRLRSLKAAVEERERNAHAATIYDAVNNISALADVREGGTGKSSGMGSGQARGSHMEHTTSTLSKYANPPTFTKEMQKEGYTVLAPQMSPIHFSLLKAVFTSGGYNFELLEHASREDVESGLKFVNNDACYPAIMVVGQLVHAFIDGSHDPDKCAVIITQTGGMCRATNYVGLLRKGLADAGYPQVPVIALSTQGFESNPGLQVTPALLHRAVKAFLLGDLMLKCLLRVRPYEVEPGSADKLYHEWDAIVRETIEHHGHSATAKADPSIGRSYFTYGSLAKAIVTSFDAFPLRNIPRKPRVGVVGEILVKFHPDANNHVINVIETQGCEAVMPGITEFMVQNLYTADWNKRTLGTGGNLKVKGVMRDIVELYEKPIRKAIDLAHGKFTQDLPMDQLVEKASSVTSVGVQAGEGWLLTGEIMELIDSGTPNIICAQPFACLPNHVTGRGMFNEIRRQRADANIVSIDYDPGSSEANQLNRIKLMISAAKKAAAKQPEVPAKPELETAS